MKPLDMRDIAIIDALPLYGARGLVKGDWRVILNVGCGNGRIDWYLFNMGFNVIPTDIKKPEGEFANGLRFQKADIFDLSSFPIPSASVVICSQVLEHLKNWKFALKHLIKLTSIRLIITVPVGTSFHSKDHVNFWHNADEFHELCYPYSVSTSRIRTKPEDVKMNQWNWLIVVDKRQNL